MILGTNGEAAKPVSHQETPTEQTEEQKREELLSKPFLGVDQDGNLTLHIPFSKTNEIMARGLVDIARSRVLEWYAKQARAQAEEYAKVQALAAKTGYSRFKDKLSDLVRRK